VNNTAECRAGQRGEYRQPSVWPGVGGIMARKGFSRFYFKHGVLGFERYRGIDKVFFSFEYKPDNWRVGQVRNMRIGGRAIGSRQVRGWWVSFGKHNSARKWGDKSNQIVSDNEWQSITSQGDRAIERWIDKQLKGKSCIIVLIGSSTANRKWINYEIRKAWNDRKGAFGIYIHNLKDSKGSQSPMGPNPFSYVSIDEHPLSDVAAVHNPPFTESKQVYSYIQEHLASWVEDAIRIRDAN
jgi:hypothetical protein